MQWLYKYKVVVPSPLFHRILKQLGRRTKLKGKLPIVRWIQDTASQRRSCIVRAKSRTHWTKLRGLGDGQVAIAHIDTRFSIAGPP